MKLLSVRIFVSLIFFLLVGIAHSDAVSRVVKQEITLSDAIAQTLQFNPELAAFGYQLEMGKGLLTQASLASNPKLNIEVEDVLGSGDFNALDSAQTTISIGWLLEHGKVQRRKSVAEANLNVMEQERDLVRIEKAAETARRYLICLLVQENIKNLTLSVELANKTLAAAKRRVEASIAPAAERARARADLAQKELLLEDAEHELETAYRYLSAQWGEAKPVFIRVQGELRALPVIESYESLTARLENNPEYAQLSSQRKLSESELALARELGKPQWELSAGVRRYESEDDQAFIFGLSVPLTWKNRNQGQIAASRAKLSRIEADRKVIDLRLQTELFALYQELRHSEHRATALREVIIPGYQQALKETQLAYRRGRYSYLELQNAQAELIQANESLLETIANAHQYVIEIERLTGESIVERTEQTRESS